MSGNRAKNDTDKAVTFLTIISLGVVCVQTLIGTHPCHRASNHFTHTYVGLVSMNCEVPHNSIPGDKYTGFAIVIAIGVVIIAIYSSVVRYWWIRAKRRRLTSKLKT